ncbi:hypothetical protein AVV02_gp227 [Bacillus phage AvesoBmore]|uniref:Uncharacterized protein n=5 Tax=Bastillevirinae TaxID=2560070 RepID=A0A0K2D0S0_9CAUD|nr:hypothetical protein AVV02_gp227 [Bacillus phage AvesoBmore]ALA13414.1 hypothetical protein AVESOBMORE_227 [Bacillus phage AvesoBmore]
MTSKLLSPYVSLLWFWVYLYYNTLGGFNMSITTLILLNTTMLLATAAVNAVQCVIIMKELKHREE